VELLTPEGNWSSYPPHKHDPDEPRGSDEAVLEEIYYFELRGANAFGLHRTYTADGSADVTVAVHDRDAFLIPRGYHGPCIAAPGYEMYYLNVLAGPGAERSLSFGDDPRYGWVRESWSAIAIDDRLPLTGHDGRRRGGPAR
jgi:5-deoxy-glucuronate isomerase